VWSCGRVVIRMEACDDGVRNGRGHRVEGMGGEYCVDCGFEIESGGLA